MPLIPGDLLAILGLAGVVGTVAVLVFSDWPKAYVLSASSIVLYGFQQIDCFTGGPFCLGLDELALSTDTLTAGAWWTPVSYAFLHAGLFHIFGNLFILVTAGPALEDSIGPRWFLVVYALGGLAAAGAGVGLSLTSELVASQTLMVGASGAIFAVLTAYAVRHPREKLPIILFLVVWLPAFWVLMIYLLINVAYLFTDTNVAWYGHFAGFAVGLAVASTPVAQGKVKARRRQLDPEALEPLATSALGQEAIKHLTSLGPEDDDEVVHAWLDVLAEDAACTVCGGAVRRKGVRLVCEHGHDLTVAPKGAEARTADDE